jgi:hypothetical protein
METTVMARRKPATKTTQVDTLYRSMPTLPLAPEEQLEHWQALAQAILSELAPATPYETLLARDLIDIERSIQIYRRRQASIHLTAARNLLWDELRRRQNDPRVAQLGDPGAFSASWAYGSPDERREAAEQLVAVDVYEADVYNTAYLQNAAVMADLLRTAAQFEVRRRNLMQDFRSLKAQRKLDTVPLAELQD